MEKYLLSLTLIVIIGLSGCNSKNKTEEIAGYASSAKADKVGSAAKSPGDWVKEGIICYGLVVGVDKDGKPLTGKPVKAKVVKIDGNEVKMKALESVSVSEVKGCTKMGMQKGETWIEKDGDLFQTKEEAISSLKAKKIFLNS